LHLNSNDGCDVSFYTFRLTGRCRCADASPTSSHYSYVNELNFTDAYNNDFRDIKQPAYCSSPASVLVLAMARITVAFEACSVQLA